jgi:hypothetical protein
MNNRVVIKKCQTEEYGIRVKVKDKHFDITELQGYYLNCHALILRKVYSKKLIKHN